MKPSMRNVQVDEVESAVGKGFVYADSDFLALDSQLMLCSGIFRPVLALPRMRRYSYLDMPVCHQ